MKKNCINKNMKMPTVKTVVVCLTKDNISEFDIDIESFDDPFLEAATRAIEEGRKSRGKIIHPTVTVWEKKSPRKTQKIYNSYWILINAGCYAKAELLREKFAVQTDIDLSKQPYQTDKK